LKKKSLLILATVAALSAIMLVSAVSYLTFTFNMNANVTEGGTVTVTIGSTTYNTGQSLSVDWGSVTPGQVKTQAITIHNNVNAPVTPSIAATGLPSGWSLALSSTAAIPAFSDAPMNLVLTVSSTAPAGPVTAWTATLSAAS
jgi:hypothetical protein